jgi:hypothetical protein
MPLSRAADVSLVRAFASVLPTSAQDQAAKPDQYERPSRWLGDAFAGEAGSKRSLRHRREIGQLAANHLRRRPYRSEAERKT